MNDEWKATPTLIGEVVELRAMRQDDAPALLACTARDTFKFFATRHPPSWDEAGFASFIAWHLAVPSTRMFAVIERATGTLVGCTCYLDVDAANRSVEIGCTFYDPEVRGTKLNPEAKLLLMRHAFETLGCERVFLKTDGRNMQSQRAIAKLGARYEGTLRRHRILPDGFIRDTVYFSVVKEEWPEVKVGLMTRLGRSEEGSRRSARVRSATAADVEQVLPLVEKICAMHRGMDARKYGFVPDIVERYRTWLPQRAADARSVLLVAEDDSGLAGFVVGTVEPEIPIYEVKEFGFIHDVWVEPRARRQGVGRMLALAALERFRAMGVKQVRLDTAIANEAARRLFAGCGFRASATEMIAEL
ncbi:MAG: GNAT family N-acetyltransferase [Planctomycetes bacterium]|nr:GNAT family N-acetyltransferase [Planctomycetota bacterium]